MSRNLQSMLEWHATQRYSAAIMPLPPLRYLDITPVEHEGETGVLLSDAEGIVEDPLVLTPVAYFIAAQLDGAREVADVQAAFANATGGGVLREEDVERVVAFLDEHGFLLSESYLSIRAQAVDSFGESPIRPAYLDGKAYPKDPAALRLYLDDQFTRAEGPKKKPGALEKQESLLRCLVVPHIDYERGGGTYAHGYARLLAHDAPEVVFIFGVAHAGSPTPFVLTKKHFDTPLGLVETDVALVERIAAGCSWDVFINEFVHRAEHSIEFHAVMLRHLYGDGVRIVPILCGPFLNEENSIAAEVHEFLAACRAAIAESGMRVSVIASADFSHVGRRFGDDIEVDDQVLASIRSRDLEDIEPLLAVDAEEWFASVMRDDNARRVCGVNCIYSALKTVEGTIHRGELVHYDHAPDPAGGIVSFANIVFSPLES